MSFASIMTLLEGRALDGVFEDFRAKLQAFGTGLSLPEFVGSCLRHIPKVRHSKSAIARDLGASSAARARPVRCVSFLRRARWLQTHLGDKGTT